MPIGLDDLRPRRKTTDAPDRRAPRSSVARPWTQDMAASGTSLSRKRIDFADVAMNEEWSMFFMHLPFTDEQEDEVKRWHDLQRRFERLESRVRRVAQTPARTVRAIRRFCFL